MRHEKLVQSQDVLKKLLQERKGGVYDLGKFDVGYIDQHLRFKPSEMYVVTGHANVGKTHALIWLMLLHSVNNGTKWLVFSSENEVHDLKRKMIQFLAVKRLDEMTEAEVYRHLAFVDGHFQFIKDDELMTLDDLLSIGEDVMTNTEFDFDGMLIDPYNSLTIDQKKLGKVSTHEYHYQAASEVRQFAKKNGKIMIINMHPVTEAGRRLHPKGHDMAGHNMPVMAQEVEGGSKWYNRCDGFISVHRYISHPQLWIFTEIHVRKVKVMETGGMITPLEDPIRLQSMIGNVGFTAHGQNLMYIKELKTDDDGTPLL